MIIPISGAASVICHSPDTFDAKGLSLAAQKAQSSNDVFAAKVPRRGGKAQLALGKIVIAAV
jgi:hypothetical protein